MAPGPTVEFGEVFVVRETETALLCRIGEKFHWVAHSRLQPGSTVEHPGDLGVLVLPWDFAVEFWEVPSVSARHAGGVKTPEEAPAAVHLTSYPAGSTGEGPHLPTWAAADTPSREARTHHLSPDRRSAAAFMVGREHGRYAHYVDPRRRAGDQR